MIFVLVTISACAALVGFITIGVIFLERDQRRLLHRVLVESSQETLEQKR